MNNKEAINHLSTYSTTMGSGQTSDFEHEIAKKIGIEAIKQDERIHSNPAPELQELFDFVENKLGIRLYTWQKTYIAYGIYRQSGLTTAKILRLLFNPCRKIVIDLTGFPKSPELKFERDEMVRIYKELKDQKIDITRCLLTKEDRKAYLDQGGSYDSIVDYNSVLQRPEIY